MIIFSGDCFAGVQLSHYKTNCFHRIQLKKNVFPFNSTFFFFKLGVVGVQNDVICFTKKLHYSRDQWRVIKDVGNLL